MSTRAEVAAAAVLPPLHAGIVDYMGEQAGPPSKQVQAAKQVQELLKDGDDVIIVGIFSSEQDAAYETYIEACKGGRLAYQ